MKLGFDLSRRVPPGQRLGNVVIVRDRQVFIPSSPKIGVPESPPQACDNLLPIGPE